MKFEVIIYKDEDGSFIAECPSIPGCVSQGKTESEVLTNIKSSIDDFKQVRMEKGMLVSIPFSTHKYKEQYLIPQNLPSLKSKKVIKNTLKLF
jgi:predicted RNase H-like HicB family nuclease